MNILINGDFNVAQRGLTLASITDDTYGPDRWYGLTQTAAISGARQSVSVNMRPYLLTQIQASAQRFGLAQIVEFNNSFPRRSSRLTFFGRVNVSTSQPLRIAILEWTGTANSVTSDVVNSWTNGTYTAGNFFLGSNLTVTKVGVLTPLANTWTDFWVSGVSGNSVTNLIVMIWTEGTAAQNFTMQLANCGLMAMAGPPEVFIPKPTDLEFMQCYRYYQKSFLTTTTPAQNIGLSTGEYYFPATTVGATVVSSPFFSLPVDMFSGFVPILYNPSAANAQIRNVTDSADLTSSGLLGIGSSKGFSVIGTGNAGMAVGEQLAFHWTAEAEL